MNYPAPVDPEVTVWLASMSPLGRLIERYSGPLESLLKFTARVLPRAYGCSLTDYPGQRFKYKAWPVAAMVGRAHLHGYWSFTLQVADWEAVIDFHSGTKEARERVALEQDNERWHAWDAACTAMENMIEARAERRAADQRFADECEAKWGTLDRAPQGRKAPWQCTGTHEAERGRWWPLW